MNSPVNPVGLRSFKEAGTVDVSRMQTYTLAALAVLKARGRCPVEAWVVASQVSVQLGHALGESTVRSRLKELADKGEVDVVDRNGTSLTGRRCARYGIGGRDE